MAMPSRPPGPSLRLWTTAQVILRPFECMPRWLERYGDPVLVPTVNGDVVLTAKPELVKRIFAQPASTYAPFAAKGMVALTGARSVFQLRDKEHRRHRRLMMPPFHGSRMRAYATAMHQTAQEVFEQAAGSGTVTLHELTQRISLEIILRTVFGVQEPANVRRFAEAITALVDATSPVFLFMPFMQRELGGFGPYARFRRVWEQLDRMLQEQLELARDRDEGVDVLHMLLQARDEDGRGLDDEEIRDELRTLLFAGHETTAIALCWAVDALGRHPAVSEQLLEQLRELPSDADPEQMARVPLLDAVCNETLRLNPIVTEVLRHLHEPLELGGYDLQPPMAVSPSIVGIHMREDLYPEPKRFRPERFLERKFGPHEFLPFGGGHRRCVGAAFASFEMRIVVGTLLRQFEVELQDPRPPRSVRRNVTMAPRGGVPVTLRRSRPGRVRIAA